MFMIPHFIFFITLQCFFQLCIHDAKFLRFPILLHLSFFPSLPELPQDLRDRGRDLHADVPVRGQQGMRARHWRHRLPPLPDGNVSMPEKGDKTWQH